MRAKKKDRSSGPSGGATAPGGLSVRVVVQAPEVAAFDQRLAGREACAGTCYKASGRDPL